MMPEILEAGRESDRKIAEELGWTNFEEVDRWEDDADYGFREWKDWRGLPPEGGEEHWVPEFTTSTDAALELFEGKHFAFWKDRETYQAAEILNDESLMHDILDMGRGVEFADSPALALCRVFWASRYKN